MTIVTPTPSRLDARDSTRRVDAQRARRPTSKRGSPAEVVHLHGLWQAHTRRGARAARAARRPLPDRRARHGRALGLAAQALEEAASTWPWSSARISAGRRACTPSPVPRSATCGRSPRGRRSASSPTALTRPRSTTCPRVGARSRVPRARRQVRAALLRPAARQERARPAGRGPRPGRAATIPTCICCSPATTTAPCPRSATGWPSSA